MNKKNILIFPGDEIGPEITTEAIKVIDYFNESKLTNISYDFADIGGAALDKYDTPIKTDDLDKAKKSDAILLAAVGTPKYDNNPREKKPEYGLLALRKHLNLFINIRPIFVFNSLLGYSSLKSELISDLDIVIIRELIGDVYFGEPRGFKDINGDRVGYNTMLYSESEVQRITQFAIEAAKNRQKQITSIDKANVLELSLIHI